MSINSSMKVKYRAPPDLVMFFQNTHPEYKPKINYTYQLKHINYENIPMT